MFIRPLRVLWVLALVGIGCSLEKDPPRAVIQARFDTDEGVIPKPTDLLRDDDSGLLDLPIDDEDLSATEIELRMKLNTLNGWPTTSELSVEFTGSVSEDTLTPNNVQVWKWGATPSRVTDVVALTAEAGTKIVIAPPEDGWEHGEHYVAVVRGGPDGVRGRLNEQVEPEPAFYYARLASQLDDPANEKAFPGDTRAERLQNAADLEEVRVELSPYFDFFETAGMQRDEVASLWSFTVNDHVELAMDKATQRMPLPFDLLIDPVTGLVDLPVSEHDTEVEAEAKRQLKNYDGFALSANLLFETTRALDPETLNGDNILLYEMADLPLQLPVTARLLPDGTHVVIEPARLPLKERTTYLVVVKDGVRSRDGKRLVAMPMGSMLTATLPLVIDGKSQIDSLSDFDADRIERIRVEVARLLDQIDQDRESVVTAWTFTTLTVVDKLRQVIAAAEELDVSPDPENIQQLTPGQALLDFPFGIASIFDVEEVFYGTIKAPVFLGRTTRAWREDGGHEIQDIHFAMTIPKNAPHDEPIPVVIFGHGLFTERRFVLAIGDGVGRKGFAAIAIDFPYHGERTYCKRGGPISIPNPLSGELIDLNPCASGTSCAVDGRCVDAWGQGNALNQWPIINYPQASGSAFLELEEIANTRDHFVQALMDLRTLSRALHEGDWESAIGYQLQTDRFWYAGQSLGGILGATYVALSPKIERAVLNVPGADLVDMFDDSWFFSGQVDAFFQRENIKRSSYEAERFLNVARWFTDAVDPHSLAHLYAQDDRKALIQMATLDFIIPNPFTIILQELSGLPMREYLAEHGFLTIPIEPAFLAGIIDMADFLAGEIDE
jgi:pimeloyl-ACP methyl ester carboxylesterase